MQDHHRIKRHVAHYVSMLGQMDHCPKQKLVHSASPWVFWAFPQRKIWAKSSFSQTHVQEYMLAANLLPHLNANQNGKKKARWGPDAVRSSSIEEYHPWSKDGRYIRYATYNILPKIHHVFSKSNSA